MRASLALRRRLQCAHKSSKCNASLTFSVTVGEEPEVELALV